MNTLHQSTDSNKTTVAYNFGQRDAQAGEPCVPEMLFIQRQQQGEYAQSYESIAGATLTTAQFTGSELPAPITSGGPQAIVVSNYSRRNGREYTRRTEQDAGKMLKLAEAHNKRLEAMRQATAAFLGVDNGDIIFA